MRRRDKAYEITKYAAKHVGPMYLRFGRSAVEDVHDDSYTFTINGNLLRRPN